MGNRSQETSEEAVVGVLEMGGGDLNCSGSGEEWLDSGHGLVVELWLRKRRRIKDVNSVKFFLVCVCVCFLLLSN